MYLYFQKRELYWKNLLKEIWNLQSSRSPKFCAMVSDLKYKTILFLSIIYYFWMVCNYSCSSGKTRVEQTLPNNDLKIELLNVFLQENFLWQNKPQKPRNLKKMLRKFPASNVRAAIFKNADFSKSSLTVTKLSKF